MHLYSADETGLLVALKYVDSVEMRMLKKLFRTFPDDLEDAEFPIYLTPVLLAAQTHRADILKLLLSRPGASIELHPLTGQTNWASIELIESAQFNVFTERSM